MLVYPHACRRIEVLSKERVHELVARVHLFIYMLRQLIEVAVRHDADAEILISVSGNS